MAAYASALNWAAGNYIRPFPIRATILRAAMNAEPTRTGQHRSIFWFDALSTMAWQMCLTSPLILFMRELGAPALALGLLTGLNPLLTLLQLPMARRVQTSGHRRLMLFGWTTRTVVITPLVALPWLADSLGRSVTIVIVLALVALFMCLRSVAVVAWMPWISALIPAKTRGAFLARDRFFMTITTLVGLGLSGLLLTGTHIGNYAWVFLIGTAAAYGSLYFLARIPEPQAQAPEKAAAHSDNKSATLIRRAFALHSFRRLVLFAAPAQAVNVGAAAFVTVFARTRAGLTDSTLLWLTAGSSLLVMAAMAWVRDRLDRHGSKPFLWITLGWWAAAAMGWLLIGAAGSSGASAIAAVLIVVSNAFAWLFEVFTMRLMMNTITSETTDTTIFAVYSVVVNMIAGAAPILLGALLDGLRAFEARPAGLHIDNYSVLFALLLAMIAIAASALRNVRNL